MHMKSSKAVKQCSKECICKGIHLIIPHSFLTAEFVTSLSLSPCNLFIYLISFLVFLFFTIRLAMMLVISLVSTGGIMSSTKQQRV